MRGLILPVALAVVLLSGCGKNEQSASQSERASSSSLPAAGDSAPSVQLKPGLWESSFEVEDIAFKGMPGGDQPMLDNMKSSMRRTALRYCITPEEAARPNPDFLAAQKESHCTYKKMAMDGGTINAEVVCEQPEGQGRIQSKMTGHYSPGTYDMAMDMQTTAIQGGMSMHMKARTSGKWISAECPADLANER